jgi:hypothetical protein
MLIKRAHHSKGRICKMWKFIAALCIGVVVGLMAGYYVASLTYKPLIGDHYTIDRPKIKGDNNTLQIEQENLKDENNIKFRKWKNRRKIK